MLVKDLRDKLNNIDKSLDDKPINVVITDDYTAYDVDYIEDDPDGLCLDFGIHIGHNTGNRL